MWSGLYTFAQNGNFSSFGCFGVPKILQIFHQMSSVFLLGYSIKIFQLDPVTRGRPTAVGFYVQYVQF